MAEGVDFSTHLYVPEVDVITGQTIHERGDHNHILKRVATSTREGHYPVLNLQAFDDAMRDPNTGKFINPSNHFSSNLSFVLALLHLHSVSNVVYFQFRFNTDRTARAAETKCSGCREAVEPQRCEIHQRSQGCTTETRLPRGGQICQVHGRLSSELGWTGRNPAAALQGKLPAAELHS